MAKGPTSDSAGVRRPFTFAGDITVWDPIHRHLEIGRRTFRVASGVTVTGLTAGVHVTITGYVERSAAPASLARWIVTQLTLG
jgi:hypothetical protein